MRFPKSSVLALAAASLLALSGGAATAANVLPGKFQGGAASFGASLVVGPISTQIATAAAAACPCQGTNGRRVSHHIAAVSLGTAGNVATTGVTVSSAIGTKTDTAATSQQISLITKVNLLGGLITADALRAVANVDASASSIKLSSAGSYLTNLVVAGIKIPASVPYNTTLALPGLGSVTIKYVRRAPGPTSAAIEVDMLRVVIGTQNTLGLPVGAVLIVSEASAGYDHVQPPAALGGYAASIAVTAEAGKLLQEAIAAGASSAIADCSGTGGQTLTQTVVGQTLPGLLSVAAITTSASGGMQGATSVAKTSASVANISLLGGLVTASGIVAVAEESRTGKISTPSTEGSTFGSLSIAGVPFATNVAPNTTIGLPGLGYIVLNEQPAPTLGHVQVNGMHIVVTLANTLSLPIGADIFLGHAEAKATVF